MKKTRKTIAVVVLLFLLISGISFAAIKTKQYYFGTEEGYAFAEKTAVSLERSRNFIDFNVIDITYNYRDKSYHVFLRSVDHEVLIWCKVTNENDPEDGNIKYERIFNSREERSKNKLVETKDNPGS